MQVMFARPFPAFSNQMNAWATSLTCQWLMGPNKVNDVQLLEGKVRPIKHTMLQSPPCA